MSLAGLAALAWWEGTLHYGTPDARWSISTVIAVVVGATVVFGVHRQRLPSRTWLATAVRTVRRRPMRSPLYAAGIAVWVVLLTAFVAWDLFSFLSQSHDLPTMSYLIGRVTRSSLGRSAVFLAWLGIGSYLALGWRRPRER